jgi:hypothetical protein
VRACAGSSTSKRVRTKAPDSTPFLDNECERYPGQLELYRRLFAQWELRLVRAGLYFPLLREWREVGAVTTANSATVGGPPAST